MTPGRSVVAIAVALAAVSACGAPSGSRQPAHDQVRPVAGSQLPDDPCADWAASLDGTASPRLKREPLPNGFQPVLLVTCTMEERTDPSTGEWTYRVEKRATDGLDAVVAALRSTPSPPPTDEYACAGDLVSDPWFLLVDADNNAVLPAVPHDQACGGPIDLGLENLQYTTGDAVRMRQQSTAAELASGCPDQWKNEPRIAVHMNNSAAATAPQTVSSPPTAVCTYSGSDEVGDFRGGTLLDSRDAARIGDLLSGGVPGPADDCPIADGFAVVHTADHAWVYVELSGCRRMFLDGGSTYTAPVPDLVNAINGLDLQR